MPALEQGLIDDLKNRLHSYLKNLGGYGDPEYLDSGGSAAVFCVQAKEGYRVFKVFNYQLFDGPSCEANKRRLQVQRGLIGHNCPSLVQTFRVEEAEDTAFIEMEFISWPQLTDQLAKVPDEAIVPLISQLVAAVRFLEEQNIVHRDIKPENIHVSSDFTKLILLDLGVARQFDACEQDDASISDHGNQRPFLATAQYSSPEYLFRLDEPTENLWRGLNFYQIGAVLHDLIVKKPIFQDEMVRGNRWLVAKAILTKVPAFIDLPAGRLPHLRALASRCLVKDLDVRLQIVGWGDFVFEEAGNPLISLQKRLAKGHVIGGVSEPSASRLEFDRMQFVVRFTDRVRLELIQICGTQLPLTVKAPSPEEPSKIEFKLVINPELMILCNVEVEWQIALYVRSANIKLASRIMHSINSQEESIPIFYNICTATIFEGEDESIICLSMAIAKAAELALDLLEASKDIVQLHDFDLHKEGVK